MPDRLMQQCRVAHPGMAAGQTCSAEPAHLAWQQAGPESLLLQRRVGAPWRGSRPDLTFMQQCKAESRHTACTTTESITKLWRAVTKKSGLNQSLHCLPHTG